MPAYDAGRRAVAQSSPSPQAMLAVAVLHVAAVAAVMSARMDLPERLRSQPTEVQLIELPKPPPPRPPEPRPSPSPPLSMLDSPPIVIPVPQPDLPLVDTRPVPEPLPGGTAIGAGPLPQPTIQPRVIPAPVRTGPRFATPDHALRPPYPHNRLDRGEEAVLRLRLAIDERGRVVSVTAVGAADRAFLEAARRHLIARWRYQPATEDGRPVASSTVITLRFELE